MRQGRNRIVCLPGGSAASSHLSAFRARATVPSISRASLASCEESRSLARTLPGTVQVISGLRALFIVHSISTGQAFC